MHGVEAWRLIIVLLYTEVIECNKMNVDLAKLMQKQMYPRMTGCHVQEAVMFKDAGPLAIVFRQCLNPAALAMATSSRQGPPNKCRK